MKAKELENWILENYVGVVVTDAYRERSFFYNPDALLLKGIYFATIKESDGPNDKASALDREGVFRLSVGIGKKSYQSFFGDPPPRPAKGEHVNLTHDFKALRTLMPHPVYAWMGWVAINKLDVHKLDLLRQLLDLSYENALTKFAKKSGDRCCCSMRTL